MSNKDKHLIGQPIRQGVSFEKLFLFDSTTIRLFSEVMKGVGRNPKNEGKKKGGLKVNMLVDAHSNTPKFVRISDSKIHDKNFIQYLSLPKHSMIVFDRAYNHYLQFARFTQNKISFVCRTKEKCGISGGWKNLFHRH